MADKQTFETVLLKHGSMNATGIEIPFDVEAVFGAKRVPVKARINGAEYRGSIVRMGGKYLLGVPKEFRERAGIEAGEHIVVTVERDETPRLITPPDDLITALREAGLAEAFARLSYTHQKEYVRAVEDAKTPETRMRRIAKAVETVGFIVDKKK